MKGIFFVREPIRTILMSTATRLIGGEEIALHNFLKKLT